MRRVVGLLLITLIGGGCAGGQGRPTIASPEIRQQAVDEVTQIVAQNCEQGIHGPLDHVATDDPLLIVGTAGETMEGRASLDEIHAEYGQRNIQVRHDCSNARRWVFSSASAGVVWVEEAIRTQAQWPGINVDFPSKRTMVFERTENGWRLRYTSLSVQVPDDSLDEIHASSMTPTEEQPQTPPSGAEESSN